MRFRVRLAFVRQDCWIGLYWKRLLRVRRSDASDHRGALPMSGEIGYPCGHESHSGIGDDLWKCDICGEVVRYVDDPDGDIWMTTLHPYANRKVRTEVVTPGDGRRMDAAGAPVAPCSGRHHNNWCTTCGHEPSDHNEELICLVCHQLCDYCGTFRDQHTDTEWTSCQRDLEPVDNDDAW